MENIQKYLAFISYRHKPLDIAAAKAIQTGLETYRLPASIQKKTGLKKVGRCFRDRDELPTSSDLAQDIVDALESSDWLIVVCTPDTPSSRWCVSEIETFIRQHGRSRVLAVLVAGEPEESFPDILRFDTQPDGTRVEYEPLAADLRSNGTLAMRRKLKIEKFRLLAPMLGVGFDDLRRRARERFLKIAVAVSVSAALFFALFGGYTLSQAAVISRQNVEIAQKNDDLTAQIAETNRQKELAEINEAEAVKQSGIAKENEQEAIKQAGIAKENEQEAIKQAGIAKENEARAIIGEAEALRQTGIAQTNEELARENEARALLNEAEANRQSEIARKNEAEARRQEGIARTNEARAVAGETEAIAQRNAALTTQSRFLADLSAQQLNNGDRVTASLLALEALPKNVEAPERPLIPEAMAALRNSEVVAGSAGYAPFTILKHTNTITAHGFSRFNIYYTATGTGDISSWDLSTGELIKTIPADRSNGVPKSIVFDNYLSNIREAAYVFYEDCVQYVSLRDMTARRLPIVKDSTSHGYTGALTFSGGTLLYGALASVTELSDEPKSAFNVIDRGGVTSVAITQGNSTYSYLYAIGCRNTFSVSEMPTVSFWDGTTGQFMWEFPLYTTIDQLEFAPNRASIAIVTNGIAQLWSVQNKNLIHELNPEYSDMKGKKDHYYAVEAHYNPNSTILAVRMESGVIYLYDVTTGGLLRELRNNGRQLMSLEWNITGTEILSVCDDQSARIFDVDTGEIKNTLATNTRLLEAHYLNEMSIALIASTEVHIWKRMDDPEFSACIPLIGQAPIGTYGLIYGSAWSPNGKYIAVAYLNGWVDVFDAGSGGILCSDKYVDTPGSQDSLSSIRWSSDSEKLLVSGEGSTGVVLKDALSGRLISSGENPLNENGNPVILGGYAAFNADETLYAVNAPYSYDEIRIHEANTGKIKLSINHGTNSSQSCQFAWSPTDPSLMMTWQNNIREGDYALIVRSVETGIKIKVPGKSRIIAAAWSPDGTKIALSRYMDDVCVLDAATGDAISVFTDKSSGALVWSPDGDRIAMLGDNNEAWIWDWRRNAIEHKLRRIPRAISGGGTTDISWSSDGLMLCAGSAVYETRNGQQVMTLPDTSFFLNSMVWSPDGTRILAEYDNTTSRIWGIPPISQVMSEAKFRLGGRILSNEERTRYFLD